MRQKDNIFEMTEEEIAHDRQVTVVAKRKGQRVRWRNTEFGYWESGWFPTFVHVPNDLNIVGMNLNEVNEAIRGFPER